MNLRVGISPCPNDTFAFHAIMERRIDLAGLDPEIQLLDIQQLNEGLAAGALDVAKASFHAALRLADRYGVLRAGAALGFGVGPLLLAAEPRGLPGADDLVLCPGADTTAVLLLRCLHPAAARIEHRPFDDIMPALARGEAAYGVVIHEGRFTYRQHRLYLVEDLGAAWERTTGGPVPLGGVLARLDLPVDVHRRLSDLLVRSIDYAWAHQDEALPTMQRHARELAPEVLRAHVDLYVNAHTRDLGPLGEQTLNVLGERARAAGIVPPDAPPLRLLGDPAPPVQGALSGIGVASTFGCGCVPGAGSGDSAS
jgi:1,4-dihydroxy-6-naphthoate synthase